MSDMATPPSSKPGRARPAHLTAAEIAGVSVKPRRQPGRAATKPSATTPASKLAHSDTLSPGLPSLWDIQPRDLAQNPKPAFAALLSRVSEFPATHLYDAVEQGVPTAVVLLIAAAFGNTAASVMSLFGVSETSFRRKDEAREPLPEVAGHRVMAFLRIVARLKRLLDESGDPAQVADFDLEAWVNAWVREPLAEWGGKTPADLLRNPEGQRAIEALLDRFRGGLPA
jgi:uncharacterized protein (DUF2384 family)